MPNVTAAQLTSAGWTQVYGAGNQISVWTSPPLQSSGARMIVHDNAANKAYPVPEGVELSVVVSSYTFGILLGTLVQASTLGAGVKAAAQAALAACVPDVTLPT